MTTTTVAAAQVVPAPTVAELDALTTLTLADLMRAGAAHTTQAIGTFGHGGQACALSAAALALAALDAR